MRRRNLVDQSRAVLTGEQLCECGLFTIRGLRLCRALSGRTGRVDFREPPSHNQLPVILRLPSKTQDPGSDLWAGALRVQIRYSGYKELR